MFMKRTGARLARESAGDVALETRPYLVACVVCKRERKSEGFHLENALGMATADGSGWTWRYSPSGEWVELLCPDHADAPNGWYGHEGDGG